MLFTLSSTAIDAYGSNMMLLHCYVKVCDVIVVCCCCVVCVVLWFDVLWCVM